VSRAGLRTGGWNWFSSEDRGPVGIEEKEDIVTTRKILAVFLASIGLGLSILIAVALARSGNLQMAQTKYLTDYPGKILTNISQKSYDQVSKIFKLLPAEMSDFVRARQRLLDLIALQPSAKPPRGVSLTCFIAAEQHVTLGKPDHPAWPLPMRCSVHFNSILEKDGTPVWDSDSPVEMRFFVNDPEQTGCESHSNGEWKDSMNREIYYQSKKIGEIQGFPIYQNRQGLETVILTRSNRPIWIALAQEEFIKLCIRTSEKQLKEMGDYEKDTASLLIARMERHKAVLAAMSPSQRQAQAMYLRNEDFLEPDLAPQDSEYARPLVVVNPEWFDPALPRSAVQLICVTFDYGPSFDPDDPKPDKDGSVEALRLWEMKRTIDWKSISSLFEK
jgi:hypothetical protein